MEANRRTLTWLVTPIIILVVGGFIASATFPKLRDDHPLWLIALEPRNRNLVLVANDVDFLPFLLIATFRKLLSDPLFFLLGYLYGQNALRWVERVYGGGPEVGVWIERVFRKAAYPLVFLAPGALVCALAGVTRMKPRVFVLLNIAGTVCVVVTLNLLAGLVEDPIRDVTDWLDRNYRVLLVVSISLTALYIWTMVRQGRLQTVSQIEDEIEHGAESPPEQH
jgi:membrane protein DedA with SNARE-associated domain